MKGAIADFEISLQIAPDYTAAYFYRAVAKHGLGESEADKGNIQQAQIYYRAAIQDSNQVISFDPENAYGAYSNRGGANAYLGVLETMEGNMKQAQHHYQLAIKDCNKAILLLPENAALPLQSRLGTGQTRNI